MSSKAAPPTEDTQPAVSKKTSTSWLFRSKSKSKAANAPLSIVTSALNLAPISAVPSKSISVPAKDKGKERERDTPKTEATEDTFVPEAIGAVKDDWVLYSCRHEDYVIGEPIGFGSSAIVHLATYQPPASTSTLRPEPILVAVKIIDIDRLPAVADIDRLRKETTLMASSKHTNILRVRGEWIQGTKLYIATRYLSPGSVLDIASYAFPDGFDEIVVATILKQALEGMCYLVKNGWIHRDIKAANLLCDDDGTILLADFGVSSSMAPEVAEEGLPRRQLASRKSFVGTPCWMAPEVIERKSYDDKADVWSFGITALELSLGRAPNSYYAPAKILALLVEAPAPTLDRSGGRHKYGKEMANMIESCLLKDPQSRPSAEKLLGHPFFKLAKKKSYLVPAILSDLPPLELRQQRRRVASSPTPRYMDSWDFNSTVPSTPLGTVRETNDLFSAFSMSPSAPHRQYYPHQRSSSSSSQHHPVRGGSSEAQRRSVVLKEDDEDAGFHEDDTRAGDDSGVAEQIHVEASCL